MKSKGTKAVIDRVLEMEKGSELYLTFETEHERDVLFSDLEQRRSRLIEEYLQYEQIIIDKRVINTCPAIMLKKINPTSAYIKKTDGRIENVEL
ncbi:hypothetical protein SAMN04489760_11216 [Syntrophus gentianae]|uniref:Uncharacterized protein n=1 Tax=Syntrophus gentianae TaxID=43775 RepID=A0A1H7XT91_9BACT|nr:hypothetical protein [Syntrophus gentianae]SEM36864.1 hypothetical protein SAMN04489760_11216 [Syntrophus gentianae]